MSSLKPLKKPQAKRSPVRRVSGKGNTAARRSPLPIFYALFGLLMVVGIIVLATRYFNGTPIAASTIPIDQAVRPLSVPTGQTPEGYWYKGQADAPVTVIEFGDYQCPSCAVVFRQLEGAIDTDYVNTDKIKFVFHDFPLPMHPNAVPTAEGARCAGDQVQYWAMHDVLYSRQSEWQGDSNVNARLKSYAGELGLDTNAFGQCLDSDKYGQAFQTAITDSTQQGINGTPTYLVDGQQVDENGLRGAIDAALAAKGR
jgi:protein-disulfide isomerase